jgi:hypothetical protein
MNGLVLSEMRRFVSRRLFRLLGGLAVAGIVAAAVIAFLGSSKDPNASLADARREVASCERSQRQLKQEQPDADFGGCPTVDDLARQFDKRFVYVDSMPDASRGVAVALFVLSFVVGASFVGAEWGSGTMTTLLTWEPRRGRVLFAKALAGCALTALASALLLAFLAVVFLPVASLRGSTQGLTGSLWWTMAGIWLRGAGIAAFGAAVAMGISTITRNTAGAVGVAFAYGVILDPLLGVIKEGRFVTWLLQHNLPRILGFADVPQPRPEQTFGGSGAAAPAMLGITRPVVLFTIYAFAILSLAYATFRSRDVT